MSTQQALTDVAVVRKHMQVLKSRPMPFAFGLGPDHAPRLGFDKTRKGASLMGKLKGATGCKIATFGTATADGKVLRLEVEGPALPGLEKKVREFLKRNGPLPFVQVEIVQAERGGAVPEPGPAAELPPEVAVEPAVSEEAGGPPPAAREKLALGGSVGLGGRNAQGDVAAAQAALNREARSGLEVDGLSGPKTVAAIRAFQQSLGFRNPDGRIDPGGLTEGALNGRTPAIPPRPGGGGGGGDFGGGGGGQGRIGSEKDLTPEQQELVDDALEYARKIAKALARQKGRVEDGVKEVARKIEEFEKSLVDDPGREVAREVRDAIEKALDESRRKLRDIQDTAEDLVRDQTKDAKKAFQKAARKAKDGFDEVMDKVDEGLRWLKDEVLD